jgi:hypothetical protein
LPASADPAQHSMTANTTNTAAEYFLINLLLL